MYGVLCGCMEICNMSFSVIGGDLSIICWGKTLFETFLPILVVGIYTTAHCPKFLDYS